MPCVVGFSMKKLFVLLIAGYALSSVAQTRGYLKLSVLEGDGAINDIKRGISHSPVIQVVDESNNPVSGAEVVFSLPPLGPSGRFNGGAETYTVTSDAQGLAKCALYKPNQTEGRFNIKVAASSLGKTGTLALSQSNTLAGGASLEKKGGGKKFLVLALIGGAAGGIVAATHAGGSHAGTATAAPTILSPGNVTVGGPR